MRRLLATLMIGIVSLGVVGAGVALAAELDIVPATPDPGPVELTIDVRGFDPDTAIYALPCAIPASGDAAHVTTDDCDVAEVVTAVTDGSGRAIFTAEWDLPDEGIAVFVGDEDRSNQVTAILTTTATAELEVDTPEVEVLGTNVVQEDLAETGPRETMMLLMLAATLLSLGGISSALGHRLGLTERRA